MPHYLVLHGAHRIGCCTGYCSCLRFFYRALCSAFPILVNFSRISLSHADRWVLLTLDAFCLMYSSMLTAINNSNARLARGLALGLTHTLKSWRGAYRSRECESIYYRSSLLLWLRMLHALLKRNPPRALYYP